MKDKIFLLIVTIFTIILIFIPTGFENPTITKSSLFEKGLVLETDNSDLKSFSIVTTGTQDLKLVVSRVNSPEIQFRQKMYYWDKRM